LVFNARNLSLETQKLLMLFLETRCTQNCKRVNSVIKFAF